MQSEPMLDDTTPPAIDEAPFGEEHPNGRAPLRLVLYELAVSVPLVLWIVLNVFHHPQDFASPMLLVWAVGIAVVDLMPLPLTSSLHFSVSFPLQLAVALLKCRLDVRGSG
ncbi:MAG TPA: hypothetical protein VNN79_25680, partial [Actinomycetota bacterium]|nr:hypothetical protein [Actinomycetota bacterium]